MFNILISVFLLHSNHLEFLKEKLPQADNHQIQREHFQTFHTWFSNYVYMFVCFFCFFPLHPNLHTLDIQTNIHSFA